jgi:hypothetical protein
MPRRCRSAVLTLVIASLLYDVRATAESLPEQPPHFFQIRSTDRRINAAVAEGLRVSATFRELADRINASDVVVYVTCDGGGLPPGIDGRLTFLSTTGGFRYVIVRVNANLTTPRLVSLIGHELQHAREIADTETIVDAESLARAYATRIGYQNGISANKQRTYDSSAAIQAGEHVLREVLTGE